MKNIILITLSLLFIGNTLIAQVTPIDKRSQEELQKRTSEGQLSTATKSEASPFYVEIKTIRFETGQKVFIPKIDWTLISVKDEQVKRSIDSLEKLRELAAKNPEILVSLFSNYNFKIVSHTFAIKDNTEVHYYIISL